MPPKRLSPLEDPPAASSSEDDDDDEEEEDHEGDEEEEEDDDEEGEDDGKQVKATAPTSADKKSPVKKATANPVAAQNPVTRSVVTSHTSDDEDDDESGTESGSDSEPSPEKSGRPSRSADPNIKPISSKPMDDGSKSKKNPVKPSATPAVSTPQAKSTAQGKRPTESDKDDVKDSKRRKKKAVDEEEDAGVSEDAEKKPGDDKKKQLFQRLWTEDDELAILKGMLDYYSKKGTDPSTDMNAFHDFIKKSLHVDVSKNQLTDKIRRLKKKYLNNAGRGKEGEDPVFSKPHEHKAFELSKKIWGLDSANDVVNDQTVINGKLGTSRKAKNPVGSPQSKANQLVSEVSKVASVKAEEEIDWSMYPNLAESFQTQKEAMWIMSMPRMGDSIVKEGLRLVGTSKLKELEQKWSKLRKEEIDLFFRRMELMREQVKQLQEASGSV
ncbi:STOREKEEPER protein-like [Macadamia integrifolia]|uniref:STOREKEEPER protein-like n=1 Tax=Macadamia integrifolia TaxID=60698 RepID=UPI001C500CF5|nr:STOREKEEPER protein-like [Macadamia integrifolia]